MPRFVAYARDLIPHSGVMRTRTEYRLYSLWSAHYGSSVAELHAHRQAARELLINSLYFARRALMELANLESPEQRARLLTYRERELEKAQALYVEYRAWGKVIQRHYAELSVDTVLPGSRAGGD